MDNSIKNTTLENSISTEISGVEFLVSPTSKYILSTSGRLSR